VLAVVAVVQTVVKLSEAELPGLEAILDSPVVVGEDSMAVRSWQFVCGMANCSAWNLEIHRQYVCDSLAELDSLVAVLDGLVGRT
jgi:hypothetical protein